MEWLPKLIDSIDANIFALRQSWVGYEGSLVVSTILLILLAGALLSMIAISPALRFVAFGATSTYLGAELLGVGFSHWQSARLRWTRVNA